MLAVGDWKNQNKNKKSVVNMGTRMMYISRMWGEETPGRNASKFCLVIGTQDVITCIKFGDDRLRGFWSRAL